MEEGPIEMKRRKEDEKGKRNDLVVMVVNLS